MSIDRKIQQFCYDRMETRLRCSMGSELDTNLNKKAHFLLSGKLHFTDPTLNDVIAEVVLPCKCSSL